MNTDSTRRPIRDLLRTLLGVGLALGLWATALPGQEYQLTRDDIESALTNPEESLGQLEDERGTKQIALIGLEDVIGSEEEAAQLKERHRESIQRFQEGLRANQIFTPALERTLQAVDLTLEDVLAIHVASPAMPEGEEGEADDGNVGGEQQPAHETVYVVVSGPTPAGDRAPGR